MFEQGDITTTLLLCAI